MPDMGHKEDPTRRTRAESIIRKKYPVLMKNSAGWNRAVNAQMRKNGF